MWSFILREETTIIFSFFKRRESGRKSFSQWLIKPDLFWKRNLYHTRIRNLNYYFNSPWSCYVSRSSNATADLMKQVQSASCQNFLILADVRGFAVTAPLLPFFSVINVSLSSPWLISVVNLLISNFANYIGLKYRSDTTTEKHPY